MISETLRSQGTTLGQRAYTLMDRPVPHNLGALEKRAGNYLVVCCLVAARYICRRTVVLGSVRSQIHVTATEMCDS